MYTMGHTQRPCCHIRQALLMTDDWTRMLIWLSRSVYTTTSRNVTSPRPAGVVSGAMWLYMYTCTCTYNGPKWGLPLTLTVALAACDSSLSVRKAATIKAATSGKKYTKSRHSPCSEKVVYFVFEQNFTTTRSIFLQFQWPWLSN